MATNVNYQLLAILLVPSFGMVKGPFQLLSDLQVGNQKVTLNHLAGIYFLHCIGLGAIRIGRKLQTSSHSGDMFKHHQIAKLPKKHQTCSVDGAKWGPENGKCYVFSIFSGATRVYGSWTPRSPSLNMHKDTFQSHGILEAVMTYWNATSTIVYWLQTKTDLKL